MFYMHDHFTFIKTRKTYEGLLFKQITILFSYKKNKYIKLNSEYDKMFIDTVWYLCFFMLYIELYKHQYLK